VVSFRQVFRQVRMYVCSLYVYIYIFKLKQSHYTPRRRLGERRYSSFTFSTSALNGGEWSASRLGRALAPVPIIQEAGWTPELVWTQRLQEKLFFPAGDRTSIARSSRPKPDAILTELPGSHICIHTFIHTHHRVLFARPTYSARILLDISVENIRRTLAL
jgi:hypothetical protein